MGSIVKRTTLAHYKAAIANHTSISLVEKTRSKTSCQIASERCEKRLACHLGIMCSTHFFSITKEDPEIRQELEGLPEDCRFCYDAATEARGTAVYRVMPHNLWDVDNTGYWHSPGGTKPLEKLKMTRKESLVTKATLENLHAVPVRKRLRNASRLSLPLQRATPRQC